MSRLTRRQKQVLGLASFGFCNREIAARLGISQRTAENHLYRASLRLGASSRTQALAICRRLQLIEEIQRK